MPKWMRYGLGIGVLLAWAMLETVSIGANMKFASSLATTDTEKHLLMAAGIASDIIKSTFLIAVLYYVAEKEWTKMLGSLTLGTVAVLFSLAAAIGFLSSTRYDTYYRATDRVKETKRLEADVDRLSKEQDWAPSNKPKAMLIAEKEAAEGDLRYRTSKGCTQAAGDIEKWCREYRSIKVSIAAAEAIEAKEARSHDVREKLEKEGRSYGDAQIELISSKTGIDQKKVLESLVLLGVILIELGSMLGLMMALGLMTTERSGVGRVVGKAFSVIRGTKPAPVKVPTPEAVRSAMPPVVPQKAAAGFKQPTTAHTSGVGGLRGLLKPVVASKPAVAA